MGGRPNKKTKKQVPNKKKQEKSTEQELDQMGASKLPDIEFKAMVIRMLKGISENFNPMEKDIKVTLSSKAII